MRVSLFLGGLWGCFKEYKGPGPVRVAQRSAEFEEFLLHPFYAGVNTSWGLAAMMDTMIHVLEEGPQFRKIASAFGLSRYL